MVRFIFAHPCTSVTMPPKSERWFVSLDLNYKKIALHLATVNLLLLPPPLYESSVPFPIPLRGIRTDSNPLAFQVHFSSLPRGKDWQRMKQALCSESIQLPLPRGDFLALAQGARRRFLSCAAGAAFVEISSSPLNTEQVEGAETWVAQGELPLGSEALFRTHPETGSDEIGSHMNREAVMCARPLPVSTGRREGWGGELGEVGGGDREEEAERKSQGCPSCPLLHPSGAELKQPALFRLSVPRDEKQRNLTESSRARCC